MNEEKVEIDASKIPQEAFKILGKMLLEYVEAHPELVAEYEEATGKKFYSN